MKNKVIKLKEKISIEYISQGGEIKNKKYKKKYTYDKNI